MRALGVGAILMLAAFWSGGCNCGQYGLTDSELKAYAGKNATVAGAVKARSANYQLVSTTAPSGGAAQSPSYTVRTGIVAATDGLGEGGR